MSAIPLHLAAFDGDFDTVNRLLAEGADVNARTDANETPLYFAATTGSTEVARALLKWGADVNLLPEGGNSPLRQAIRGGYAGLVKLLLAKGADPDAAPLEKVVPPEEKAKTLDQMREMMQKLAGAMGALGLPSPRPNPLAQIFAGSDDPKPEPARLEDGKQRCLMLAIGSKSIDTLRVLLEAGYASSKTQVQTKSISLIGLARSAGSGIEMVRLLLEHGVDPNGDAGEEQASMMGSSPLQTAVAMGDVPLARLLIESGARTDSTSMGMRLLSFAIYRESREMIELLVDRNIGLDDPHIDVHLRNMNNPDLKELITRKRGTAWLALVRAGDVAGVQAALQSGADVNSADGKDGAALQIAASAGNADMARVLLDAGADVNAGNESGITALHAAAKGTPEVVELLLEHGANIQAEDRWKQTPLHRAALAEQQEAADVLIRHGAALDVVDAVLLRRLEEAGVFWSRGTPVTYASETGMTALHAAVTRGELALATSLLDRGADINAKMSSGTTPLDSAVGAENLELVRLLLDRGADPAASEQHASPLKMATMLRNEAILRLLLERGVPIEESLGEAAVEQATQKPMNESVRESVRRIARPLNEIFMLYRHTTSEEYKGTNPEHAFQKPERLWPVVRILLEFGADSNTADEGRNTLLTNLIEFDAPMDLIQYAIEKGASVNATDERQNIPLLVAVGKGRADLVETLLIAGANPDGGMRKESPLQIAREQNRPDLVALLEKHGASEARREAIITDMGDMGQFLRSVKEAAGGLSLANMPTLDFAAVTEQMKARRVGKIAERRARLEIEVRGADS